MLEIKLWLLLAVFLVSMAAVAYAQQTNCTTYRVGDRWYTTCN
jgi:hypothetical protein